MSLGILEGYGVIVSLGDYVDCKVAKLKFFGGFTSFRKWTRFLCVRDLGLEWFWGLGFFGDFNNNNDDNKVIFFFVFIVFKV